MAMYSYPGVYIQELQSPVHAISGVPTSIAAFVGPTRTGIDNRAQRIFSFSDFERLYGGLDAGSELSYAVQQFFQNGGSQAWIVRSPGANATNAAVTFGPFTAKALSSGAAANGNLLIDVDYIGLTPALKTFNLTVTDLAGGTSEYFPSVSYDDSVSNFIETVMNDPDNGSQFMAVSHKQSDLNTLKAGTTGMTQTGIVGTATTAASIGAALSNVTSLTGTVDLKASNAAVTGAGTAFTTELKPGQWLTFSSDNTNTLYQIAAITSDLALQLAQPFSGAAASKATVKLFDLFAGDNYGLALSTSTPSTPPVGLPVDVTILSAKAAIPKTLSGIASQAQQAINSVLAVRMPGASVSVTVTSLPAGGQALRFNAQFPSLPDAVLTLTKPASATLKEITTALGLASPASTVAHYALSAGTDGTMSATADIIGDPGAFTGIYALQKVDLFNLLSIPDATRANPSDPGSLDPAVDPSAIYSAALSVCDERRAFLLVDAPPDVKSVSGAVDWKTSHLGVIGPNGAAFFPRLRLPDPLNGYKLRTFAPSGVVAGVYSTVDAKRGVWKAPAGIDATLSGVQSMVYVLNDSENGVLNPLGLNCFRTFPVYGSVLWGARTLVGADASASQWKYVPVRRTALFIEESLYRGTKWVVFEPNDEPLWASIRLNVGSFMQSLFLKGAFQGTTPAQAYFVKCDRETTTQADIDLGIVNILVGFAPLKPAEFVVIQIEQLAGQLPA